MTMQHNPHLCRLSIFLSLTLLAQSLQAQSDSAIYEYLGPNKGAGLGKAVANAGDIDGDGIDDFLIGAPYDDALGGNQSGSATLFSGATGNVIYFLQGSTNFGRFGSAVAGLGDVDGDGVNDFAVGANSEDNGGLTDSGSIRIYSGATGTEIRRFDGHYVGSALGNTIAAIGDVNGDGLADMLAGESRANPSGLQNAGSYAVYSVLFGSRLYTVNGTVAGTFLGGQVRSAPDFDNDGILDAAVSRYTFSQHQMEIRSGIDGTLIRTFPGGTFDSINDLDGDGFSEVITGTYLTSPPVNPHVDVFSGQSGALLYSYSDPLGEIYGREVAGLEDYNGDGIPDFAFSSGRSTVFFQTDFVRVLSGVDGTTITEMRGNSAFGSSIADLGDLNGDGKSELLIGSYLASSPHRAHRPDTGAAFVMSETPNVPFELSLVGTCPNVTGVEFVGATPNTGVALAFGIPGIFVIPYGQCAGTILDLQSVSLLEVYRVNHAGVVSAPAPPGLGVLCGRTLQAVDLATCEVSNTVLL